MMAENTIREHRRQRHAARLAIMEGNAAAAELWYANSRNGQRHLDRWQRYCDANAGALVGDDAVTDRSVTGDDANEGAALADAVDAWLAGQ